MHMMQSARFLILLCVLFYIKESNGQLRNACRHNQFRCSDGSKCLSTEKLCNGKRDCLEGEDEKGNYQWDCSKVTLSTSCDPLNEYKCRYGGCIPRDKICDGNPDCWGGNDEALDVCIKKQVVTTSRPERVVYTVDPLRRSSTSAPPQPIRTRPTQQTQQQNTRPALQAPVPATSRPRPQPQQPVPVPQPVQSLGSSGCPAIQESEDSGFKVTCKDQFNRPFDCTRSAPINSKASYKCRDYYIPPQTGSQHAERTCQEDGNWTYKRRSFVCLLDCGDGGKEKATFIVGGLSSNKGKWPWHIALYQEDPPNSGRFEFFCGGSLISARAVLTAAHCVTKQYSSKPRDRREIRVVLGKYYRKYTTRDGSEQERNVEEIVVNEDYNNIQLSDDIAILWLDRPVIINDRVRPVCLPNEDDSDIYSYGTRRTPGQLVGWGRTGNGEFLEELQEAKIPIVDQQTCKAAHQTFQSLVRKTTFCAGYLNGTSACDGDSGGGLVFPDSFNQNRWRVQGIVSAGISKAGGGPGCEPKYYSVFTRVGEYLKWIDEKLDRHFRRK